MRAVVKDETEHYERARLQSPASRNKGLEGNECYGIDIGRKSRAMRNGYRRRESRAEGRTPVTPAVPPRFAWPPFARWRLLALTSRPAERAGV